MKRVLAIGCFVALSVSTFAQSVTIEGIKKWRFTGVHAIQGAGTENVEGYYTHYLSEKAAKGMRTFEFSIIDKGVTKVVKTQLEMHKRTRIKQTVFNGKYFLISYDDLKNKETVTNLIDETGKIVKTTKVANEKNRNPITAVYAAEGEGFFLIRNKGVKSRVGYEIEMVDNNLNSKWKTAEVPEKGYKAIADLVTTKDKFVIWEEFSPKMLSKVAKPGLACFDYNTGQKLYTRDGYDGEATIMYNEMKIEDDGGLVLGGAYVVGEKYRAANIGGIYILKLDAKGKEVLYTKVDVKTQIQPVLKETSKGFALGSKDKVFVEDIVKEGEQYIVISEMFRKNIIMTPMSIQTTRDAISGKYIGDINADVKQYGKPVTFQIMDFMLFKFNADGKLGEMKAISKEKYNKISCYYPYNRYYGMQLAKVLRAAGWFDYAFTAYDKSGTKRVMICKDNAHPRKPEVFMYNLDESYAKKKVNLKKESNINLDDGKISYFNIMRCAEDGYIALAYYQKKAKRVTVNIEATE